MKNISRADFLKISTASVSGILVLPHHSCSGIFNKKLTINGISNYQIVIPNNPSKIEKEASNQLEAHLLLLSKKAPKIINETDYVGKNGIFIGETKYANNKNIDTNNLEEDGFLFKNIGDDFFIQGGSEKGLLYGMYSLLESFGFRKYAADDPLDIPSTINLELPNDVIKVPKINYRTTNYYEGRDSEYADWNKLSSRDSWGLFVHTFEVLVPPEKYGESNPEYYSLINGERNVVTQLCLTNPDMFDVLVKDLRKRINENPKAKYWSVSQNDNDKYCQCGPCTKLNKKYGNVPSGSIVWFTNKVAREFPDKIISTLAYWYTRVAPKNIEIEPNVNIMLCNIESSREKPVFDTDPAFTKDLQDWGKMSKDILIWDYNIQFANPISPFPNLHTIGPNIKFYRENNVNALFMQATGNKAELGQLRSYLISKLMWDPDADDNEIINEFLVGYYGPASEYMREYIDTMREALTESPFRLFIFGDPRDAINNYLSAEKINRYHSIFDKAEKSVSDNSQLLKRVQDARLPLLIATIQIAGQIKPGDDGSFYEIDNSDFVIPKPEMENLVREFVGRARKAGIARIGERAITLDDYNYNFERIFSKMKETPKSKSYNCNVSSMSIPEGGVENIKRLTNGIFGAFESWRFPYKDKNWVAFKGGHMDLVLDLGEIQNIKSIETEFLNVQAQANWHQLILPKHVTYSISKDGITYEKPVRVVNPHNPNPAENPDITKLPFHPFNIELENKECRYIKIHAESHIKMPAWHINAGRPAFIYVDEIVVK